MKYAVVLDCMVVFVTKPYIQGITIMPNTNTIYETVLNGINAQVLEHQYRHIATY